MPPSCCSGVENGKYESGKGQSDRRNPGLKSELVLLRSVHLTKNF